MSPTIPVCQQFRVGPAGIRDRSSDKIFSPRYERNQSNPIDPATQRIMIAPFILGPAGIRDRSSDKIFNPRYERNQSKPIDPATQRIMIALLVIGSGASSRAILVAIKG